MVDFLFGGIIFYFGMMLASFAGAMILSCLFSGILLMWQLNKSSLLKYTNYKKYVISILLWILIFYLITIFIDFSTKYLSFWLFGSAIGFIFSFKTLSHSNMENNRIEFYNSNLSLLKSSKTNVEVAKFIYNKVIDKFNLLNEIIIQSDIFLKYDYEEDYYTIISYMYILIYHDIEIIKSNEVDIKKSRILIDCFQMMSDNLTNVKYKNKDKMMQSFCDDIIPLFKLAWHKANLNDNHEISYVLGFVNGYMILPFLNSVFNIQPDELETYYQDVMEQVTDLFMSIYIDEDIDLI